MKTRLYRKFVKLVCKDFKITKKQLFYREFNECILHVYGYDLYEKKLYLQSQLQICTKVHPLSDIWHAYCFGIQWLLKYWKYSRHRAFVQTKLDLGYTIDDAIAEVVKLHPKYVQS